MTAQLSKIFVCGLSYSVLLQNCKLSTAKKRAAEETAYIGDDLNDLDCIRWCGVTGFPADAVPEILETVGYVCKRDGGRGAAREFIDWIHKEMLL